MDNTKPVPARVPLTQLATRRPSQALARVLARTRKETAGTFSSAV